jgi:hypothetical protein
LEELDDDELLLELEEIELGEELGALEVFG